MEEPPSNVDALCRRSSQARSKKTRNAMIDVLAPTLKSSRAAIYNGCAWLICPGSPAHRQQSRRTACRWCTGGVGDCAALYRRRRADVDEHHRRRDQRPTASAHTVVISAHGAFGLRSIMIDVR